MCTRISNISKQFGIQLLAYFITASFGLLLADSIESAFKQSTGIELSVNHSSDSESGQENEESKEHNEIDDCDHQSSLEKALLTLASNQYFSLNICMGTGMQDVATPPPEIG